MASIEILEERPLTMVEMREKITLIEKRDKELPLRTDKTKKYIDHFVKKLKIKDIKGLKEKLKDLNVSRLKDRHIIKIIDLRPVDMASLRLIFTGENLTLKQDDLKRIVDAIKEFT